MGNPNPQAAPEWAARNARDLVVRRVALDRAVALCLADGVESPRAVVRAQLEGCIDQGSVSYLGLTWMGSERKPRESISVALNGERWGRLADFVSNRIEDIQKVRADLGPDSWDFIIRLARWHGCKSVSVRNLREAMKACGVTT